MSAPYCFAAGGWRDGSAFLQFRRDGSVYQYFPVTPEYWNAVILPAVRQGTWFNQAWRHVIPPMYREHASLPSELLYTFTHP